MLSIEHKCVIISLTIKIYFALFWKADIVEGECMERLLQKGKFFICIVLVLAFILTPITAFAGYQREWGLVAKWDAVLDSYEEDDTWIDVGPEGKLDLELWEKPYTVYDVNAEAAPYQIQIVCDDGDEQLYRQDFFVDASDDGSNSYHKSLSLSGLPEGKYCITIKPQAQVRFYFRAETYYSVYTEPTYKEMASFAKSLATKNIPYKNVDVGEHARLYGKTAEFFNLSSDETFAMGTTYQPYIDIRKDKKTAKLSLRIRGTAEYISFEREYLYYDTIRFYTSDRRMSFDIGYCDVGSRYDYRDGIYTCTSKWSAILSSNSKKQTSQINKLIKILKQKKVKVRIYHYEDGNYIFYQLTESERKNWLAVVQKYKKMLKEYE